MYSKLLRSLICGTCVAACLLISSVPAHALVIDSFSAAGLELDLGPGAAGPVLTVVGANFGDGVTVTTNEYSIRGIATGGIATLAPEFDNNANHIGSRLQWSGGPVEFHVVISNLTPADLTDANTHALLQLQFATTNDLAVAPLGDVRFQIEDNARIVSRDVIIPVDTNWFAGIHTNLLGDAVTNFLIGEVTTNLLAEVPGAPGLFNNFIGTIDMVFTAVAPEGEIIFLNLFSTIPEPATSTLAICIAVLGGTLLRLRNRKQ